jgi:DMSO/TMAO reductase YedYZ molybdopterin-dependent catalytic subunit
MASVKWLTKLVLIDKPYEGYWQTVDYAIWQRRGDLPELVPITAMQPKSVLTNLTDGAVVRAGTTVTVHGYAWAGELAVAKVELSVDGGKTWAQALLPGKPVPFRWVPWEAKWTIPASWKGRSVPVVSRCTDTRGNTQPDQRDPDRRTYMINHLIPVEVLVI